MWSLAALPKLPFPALHLLEITCRQSCERVSRGTSLLCSPSLGAYWHFLWFLLCSSFFLLSVHSCFLIMKCCFPRHQVLSYSPCTFILFLDGLLAYIISSTQRPLMCEESKPSIWDSRTTSDYLLDICTTVAQVLHMTCSSENLSFSACIPKPTPLLEFLTSFDDIVIQPGLQAWTVDTNHLLLFTFYPNHHIVKLVLHPLTVPLRFKEYAVNLLLFKTYAIQKYRNKEIKLSFNFPHT